jgi:nicotinamidase-related amidase
MPADLFRAEETLLLLIDFAEGPLRAVGSMPQDELRASARSLARAAAILRIPVLQLRAPLPAPACQWLPEVEAATRYSRIIPHRTNNCWESPQVVDAVSAAGRNQLVLAGIATDVGVGLTAISATRVGYACMVITDACGTVSPRAEQSALLRLTQAGVTLQSWSGFVGELQRDYTQPDGPELLRILSNGLPALQALQGEAR